MKRTQMLGLVALPLVLGTSSAYAQSSINYAALMSERGKLVIRNDANVSMSLVSYSGLKGANFGNPTMALAPALDVFVIDNLSIGGSLAFTYTKAGGADWTTFSVVPRIGYNLRLADRVSFWPQVGIGIGFISGNLGVIGTQTWALVPLDVYLPFEFHLAEHFFVGLGPGMRFNLNPDATGAAPQTWAVFDILRFNIGGWIGL